MKMSRRKGSKWMNLPSLLMFAVIFLLSTLSLIGLAETLWFPLDYSSIDVFVPYFASRQGPFDCFGFAFRHFYAYYMAVFFVLTALHTVLMRRFWARPIVGFFHLFRYLVFMALCAFTLYMVNRVYWKGLHGGMASLCLFFLELLFTRAKVILLFSLIVLSVTTAFQIALFKRRGANKADC